MALASGDGRSKTLQLLQMRVQEMLSGPKDHLLCPITHELLKDPVTAADGYTYERAAIQRHFGGTASRSCRSPMSNDALQSKTLFPNLLAKNAVVEYVASWESEAAKLTPFLMDEQLLDDIEALVQKAEECIPWFTPGGSSVMKSLDIFLTKALISRNGVSRDLLSKLTRLSEEDAMEVVGTLSCDDVVRLEDHDHNRLNVLLAHRRLTVEVRKMMKNVTDHHVATTRLKQAMAAIVGEGAEEEEEELVIYPELFD